MVTVVTVVTVESPPWDRVTTPRLFIKKPDSGRSKGTDPIVTIVTRSATRPTH